MPFGGSTATSRSAGASSSTIRSATATRSHGIDQNGRSLAKFYEYRDLRPGAVLEFLAIHRNQRWPLPDRPRRQERRLRRSELLARRVEGRPALLQLRLGPDAASLQHERADFLSRCRDHQSDAAAGLRSGRHRREHRVRSSIRPISASSATPRRPIIVGPRTMPGTSRRTTRICIASARRSTALSALAPPRFGYGATQVPRPVDDVTQNYGLNGEYVGTSPWGKRFNLKLAYNGSDYTDDFTSYTIARPDHRRRHNPDLSLGNRHGRATMPTRSAERSAPICRGTAAMSARVSYSMMRQNEAFIPMSTQNPGVPASGIEPERRHQHVVEQQHPHHQDHA